MLLLCGEIIEVQGCREGIMIIFTPKNAQNQNSRTIQNSILIIICNNKKLLWKMLKKFLSELSCWEISFIDAKATCRITL